MINASFTVATGHNAFDLTAITHSVVGESVDSTPNFGGTVLKHFIISAHDMFRVTVGQGTAEDTFSTRVMSPCLAQTQYSTEAGKMQ